MNNSTHAIIWQLVLLVCIRAAELVILTGH